MTDKQKTWPKTLRNHLSDSLGFESRKMTQKIAGDNHLEYFRLSVYEHNNNHRQVQDEQICLAVKEYLDQHEYNLIEYDGKKLIWKVEKGAEQVSIIISNNSLRYTPGTNYLGNPDILVTVREA